CRAERGIVDRANRRMTAREIIDGRFALDGELDLDRDQPFGARGVTVDEVLRLPNAVRQRREALAHGALHIVLHFGQACFDRLAAVFADEPQDLPFAYLRRLCLGLDVADDGGWVPGIGSDEMGDVPAEASLVEQAHWRDAQALTEHVPRRDVK